MQRGCNRKRPRPPAWQRDLAVTYSALANVYRRAGDRDKARAALRQGQALIDRLAKLSPNNTRWKSDLAWFESQIAALNEIVDPIGFICCGAKSPFSRCCLRVRFRLENFPRLAWGETRRPLERSAGRTASQGWATRKQRRGTRAANDGEFRMVALRTLLLRVRIGIDDRTGLVFVRP